MNWNLFAVFAAPIITTALTFILNKFFYNSPRLIAYYGHISEFKIRNPDGSVLDVYTHAVVIRNTAYQGTHKRDYMKFKKNRNKKLATI